MNFANFVPAILGILGLKDFHEEAGRKSLSAAERETLKGYNFSDRFLNDFEASLNKPEEEPSSEASRTAVVSALLGQTTEQLTARTAELEELKAKTATDSAAHASALAAKEQEIASLKDKISTLSALPEPEAMQAAAPAFTFNIHDEKQLGGMPGEMFSMDRPYNQRAQAALLANQGLVRTVAAATRLDYASLQEDLGAFYRTPWRTRLQSFLVELPTIETIFPLESGHTDLETLANVWLGEFSQADNTMDSDFDNVTKGSYKFSHETLRMYDVMFAFRFKNLKAIEKSWIAYLNAMTMTSSFSMATNGSDIHIFFRAHTRNQDISADTPNCATTTPLPFAHPRDTANSIREYSSTYSCSTLVPTTRRN